MPLESIKEKAAEALAAALEEAFDHRPAEVRLEVPPKRELGDLAWPGALPLARELKTAPRQIAEKINQTAAWPEEIIRVPDSGYSLGSGYEVLVLYASTNRITLKYTLDDNVVWGYTVHVENVCVDPNLLALYQTWNSAGRGQLPALRNGQAFGRARDSEIGVVIRDNGAFMDPRSRKDWWQGR